MIAAGTQNYAELGPGWKLDSVPADLQTVVELLTSPEAGYLEALTDLRHDPKSRQLGDELEGWLTAPERLSADIAVVYYSGHGDVIEGTFYLITANTVNGHYKKTALDSSDIVEMLRESSPVRRLLIIVDACYSGQATHEIVGATIRNARLLNFSRRGEGIWVLAASRPRQEAREALFAPAFAKAVRYWQRNTGPSQPYLGLDLICDTLAAELGETQQPYQASVSAGGLPPFFLNPRYNPEVAGLSVPEQRDWLSLVRGGPTTTGFYLTGKTGRLQAAEDLAAWMTRPDLEGLAIVTGSPGSGKSALLALPTLLTQQATRTGLLDRAEPGALVQRMAYHLPVGMPLTAIYARGLNTDQVAQAVAHALNRETGTASALLEGLETAPLGHRHIMVVDAVDEAASPRILLSGLLLPLSRQPSLRVVVGARRDVLSRIENAGLNIDLDSPRYRDPEALTDYVRRLLLATEEPGVKTCYQASAEVKPGAVDAATAEITARATSAATTQDKRSESFLMGKLLALSVRNRPKPVDIASQGWKSELPASIIEAFDQDLARLGDKEPLARTLLAALAWAKGPGLPRGDTWTLVAAALMRSDGTRYPHSSITDEDVSWLLEKAGAYVVEDIGPEQLSVYRPFHDLLAAYLRGEPSPEWEHRRRQIEKTIYGSLLAAIPTDGKALQDWIVARPYLRTYLTEHAAAAGTSALAVLVTNQDFLAVADPVALSPLLSPAIPELRKAARIYRRARPMFGGNTRSNFSYLQEASATLTNTGTAPGANITNLLSRAHSRPASRDDSILTFTGHSGPVNSVTFGTTAGGQLLLASAGDDQTVRLWDPNTGAAIGDPLPGHSDGVSSVAFGTTAHGQPLLASASWDGTVRLWDPDTGAAIGDPLSIHGKSRNGEGVNSVVFGTTAGGQLLLASAGDDQTVRLWDPNTGAAIGDSLSGHSGWVSSLAFGTTARGQPLLASASGDGTVRLWNPGTSAPIGDPLFGHSGWVSSLAFGTTARGQPLLASASGDGTVRLWDPIADVPSGDPLSGHSGGVSSLAFGTTAGGQLLLASASGDGTVRLWDPIADVPSGDPLSGHSGGVSSLAFGTTAGGQLLLASAGDDQTVRLWDPISGAPSRHGGWASALQSSISATEGPQLAAAS